MVSLSEYIKRLSIPIIGDDQTIFTDEFGNIIAKGYTRIVIGDRGPYIEFKPIQLYGEKIYLPKNQEWRVNSTKAYYVEYRTLNSNIKIYYQLKLVKYADYKLKMCYISPFELYVYNQVIITRKK